MKINYYISTKRWTGLVATNVDRMIIESCPIAKRWIGQSIETLLIYLIYKNQFLKCELLNHENN